MDDFDEELCKEKEKTPAADEEIPVSKLQYSKTKALSGDKYRLYLMQNHMRCLKLSQ